MCIHARKPVCEPLRGRLPFAQRCHLSHQLQVTWHRTIRKFFNDINVRDIIAIIDFISFFCAATTFCPCRCERNSDAPHRQQIRANTYPSRHSRRAAQRVNQHDIHPAACSPAARPGRHHHAVVTTRVADVMAQWNRSGNFTTGVCRFFAPVVGPSTTGLAG